MHSLARRTTRFALVLTSLAASSGFAVLGASPAVAPTAGVAPAALTTPEAVEAEQRLHPRAAPPRASRHRRSPDVIPLGDLPHWKQVLAQDFTSSSLPPGWEAYEGRPGGNRNGWWDPAQVRLRYADLHVYGAWRDGRFVTGGLMATGSAMTYRKYEVRFRVDRAPGVKYAQLLWPSRGTWPQAGEIDFAEDAGGARDTAAATLHYGRGNTQVQRHVRADFSVFQTVGVEWTPGRLVYTLNGRPWATIVSPHVPSGPMRLALQLEAGRGDRWTPAPSSSTPPKVALVVDWVVAYRRA
jgi:hypothetical protein